MTLEECYEHVMNGKKIRISSWSPSYPLFIAKHPTGMILRFYGDNLRSMGDEFTPTFRELMSKEWEIIE